MTFAKESQAPDPTRGTTYVPLERKLETPQAPGVERFPADPQNA